MVDRLVQRASLSARRKTIGIGVQMLVDERKRVRALLLGPVKKEVLPGGFRAARECQMFVDPGPLNAWGY